MQSLGAQTIAERRHGSQYQQHITCYYESTWALDHISARLARLSKQGTRRLMQLPYLALATDSLSSLKHFARHTALASGQLFSVTLHCAGSQGCIQGARQTARAFSSYAPLQWSQHR